MSGDGGLVLFEIRLRWIGTLEGKRLFNEPDHPYKILVKATGETCWLTARNVRDLGGAGRRFKHKFEWAKRYGGGVPAVSLFRVCDDNRVPLLEFGTVDESAVYFKLLEYPQLNLTDELGLGDLIRAFDRLAEDVPLVPNPGGTSRLAR
jgi:hypothetical protein